MDKLNFQAKNTGDTLEASEWNQAVNKIDELVEAADDRMTQVVGVINETLDGSDPTAGVVVSTGITNIGEVKVLELTKKKKGVNTTLASQNNINIEPRESVNDVKGGNISFKPGDDIEFCSHHRITENQNEVSIKVIDGDDNPVKLQVNTSSITLTTKDKVGEDSNVLDINVNRGKNTKGYLKVRAQAIDLRCEENGGIALQPKGNDGDGYENKIKFEHDGGDGLEFGTFNTQHTSIFTNDYRFNENGTIYAVTRGEPEIIYKEDGVTIKKVDYPTQSDDFKDIIDVNKSCTWGDIVRLVAWAKAQGHI